MESPLDPAQLPAATGEAGSGVVIRPIRFRQLSKPKDVRRALLKVINAMLAGELDPRIGGTVIYGLHGVSKSIELDVVERRLAAIEERLGANQSTRR